MRLDIRKLTPDLAEAYAHFFDVTPHDARIDAEKCYCVTWRSDASYADGASHWFPTREERRAHALAFVRAGHVQGYLAYRGEEIVGWCNANPHCQLALDYLRGYWPIPETRAEVRVQSIFCFVIAPELQRQGVATQLVERVCSDAAAEGFDFVEAYVNRTHEPLDFRGPLTMYEKCGFVPCGEREGRVVMRRALKE